MKKVIIVIKNQEYYNIKYKNISKKLFEIFNKKNVEYGHAFFIDNDKNIWFNDIKRKYIRINQIVKNSEKNKINKISLNENLEDLAIYAIMSIIKINE